MNIQQEALGNSQVQLTIEVDEAQFAAARQRVVRQMSKQVQVPGFRRGKAPAQLVERQLNPGAIFEETVNEIVPTVIEQAINEREIRPYSYQDIEIDIAQPEPLVIRAVIPTVPTITLGDLSVIEIEPAVAEVAEGRVDEVLDELRQARAVQEPVEGAAEADDIVTFEVAGDLMDGTAAFEPHQETLALTFEAYDDEMALDERAEAVVTDDIVRNLIGMMSNQVKEFPIEYPAEHPDETLAGRTVLYRVTVGEIKRNRLPDLDDELAQELSGDLETMEALRERIHDNLVTDAEEKALNASFDAILDAVADESEMEYPEALVRHQIEHELDRMVEPLKQYGITLERYLEIMGRTRAEVEEELRDSVEQKLRRSLVLGQYTTDRAIVATADELGRELEETLYQVPEGEREQLRGELLGSEELMRSVEYRLVSRKALYQLYNEITGAEPPPLFVDRPVKADPEPVEFPELTEWSNEGGNPLEGDLTPPASGPTQEELASVALVDEEGEPEKVDPEPVELPELTEWSNEGGTPPEGDLSPPAHGPTQEDLGALDDA